MKMSAIKSVQITIISLVLALFTSISVVFASNDSNCLNQNLDLTNNLCAQNARHIMLNNNSSLLEKMFEKAETKNLNTPILKRLTLTEVKEEIELTSVEETIVPQLTPDFESWPRPRVLSRNFEFASPFLHSDLKEKLYYKIKNYLALK